jgi:hypothetical protein
MIFLYYCCALGAALAPSTPRWHGSARARWPVVMTEGLSASSIEITTDRRRGLSFTHVPSGAVAKLHNYEDGGMRGMEAETNSQASVRNEGDAVIATWRRVYGDKTIKGPRLPYEEGELEHELLLEEAGTGEARLVWAGTPPPGGDPSADMMRRMKCSC